jgi:hypothetical protein
MSNCVDNLSGYLESLPSKWRDEIIKVLLKIQEDRNTIDCQKVKDCETLTSLSPFEIDGTSINITYKDESEVQYTRTFDFAQVINNSLNDIDPKCVASQSDWDNMTFSERISAILTAQCNCNSTTTTTSSTTTTTTTP